MERRVCSLHEATELLSSFRKFCKGLFGLPNPPILVVACPNIFTCREESSARPQKRYCAQRAGVARTLRQLNYEFGRPPNHMAQVIGLEEFGLNLKQLLSLKPRRVVYSIQVRTPPISPLVPLSPAERNNAIRGYLNSSITLLRRRYPGVQLSPRDPVFPWTIDAVSDATSLAALVNCRLVDHVMVERVANRRKRELPADPSLFAIRARIAVQVEDQRRGMQLFENRIVVVKAKSEEKAKKALSKHWREYAKPYLNSEGRLVRWQLEEILEVFSAYPAQWDDPWIEVYSSLGRRRMQPNLEWHPRKMLPNKALQPPSQKTRRG